MEYNISPFIIQFSENLGIRWYSLMYLLGFAITYFWLTRVENYDKEKISDLAFYGLLSAIVGGRIGFLLFYRPDILTSFSKAIAIWNGGLSFHGGLIAVLVFCYFFTKKHQHTLKKNFPEDHSKLNIQNSSFKIHHSVLLQLFDAMVIPTCLFLFFGRIGNFLNNELWGNITTVAWCFETEGLKGCRHPSQLYEAMYNMVLFILLTTFYKRSQYKKHSPLPARRGGPRGDAPFHGAEGSGIARSATEGIEKVLAKRGVKSALFLIWYGTFRSLTELLWRVPDWTWNGITAGQLLSIPMIIGGIILLYTSTMPSKKATFMVK